VTEQDPRAEEQVEDLDVPESESELVKGGDAKTKTPKAPAPQKQPYLEVKLNDVIITGY
jgi:hypothetical protein